MIEEKLWTTSLYFYESTQGNNKYLKEKILNFKDNKSSRQISNVRGWQSESDLIFKEEFEILRSFIHGSFGSLCNNLYKEGTYKSELITGWANVNAKGADGSAPEPAGRSRHCYPVRVRGGHPR